MTKIERNLDIAGEEANKKSLMNDIAGELKINTWQAEIVITLLDEGNTIPFIARYRKERTKSLDETQLRSIQDLWNAGMDLLKRKNTILKSIDEQGKLSDELYKQILETKTLVVLEDIYLPYKKKKKTRGMVAIEKGLEPLADLVMNQEKLEKALQELCMPYIDKEKELDDVESVLSGVRDIIAERISNNVEFRELIRSKYFQGANLESSKSSLYQMDIEDNNQEKILAGRKFEDYFEYKENALNAPSHRVLAINRGEKEGIIFANILFSEDELLEELESKIISTDEESIIDQLKMTIEDSWKRLLSPSLSRELRKQIKEKAESQAIKVFKENLRNLLLQPPLKNKNILALDPGFRTGCKLVTLDNQGRVLDTGVIYLMKIGEAMKTLVNLVNKRKIDIIAIGNGTASRETEKLVSDLIKSSTIDKSRNLSYAIVSEAGASVYSASKEAIEEFPEYDVTIRGAISIGRRIQDTLSELVKIDPRSIGVGQYQHDMPKLRKELESVVESVVNLVGVNINTASYQLLSYVSGISKILAKKIIKFRDENQKFKDRKQLLDVPRLGEKTFEQCAGFLRIPDGENPLDNTPVHPESYNYANEVLSIIDSSISDITNKESRNEIQQKLGELDYKVVSNKIGAIDKELTIKDIISTLRNPFRDPRDDYPMPLLRSDVLTIEDLEEDMELEGTITNVTDFGAFTDIGLKSSGLIHKSQLADKFVNHPNEVVKVGQIVKVRIISIDKDRQRIGLSMRTKNIKRNEKSAKSNYRENKEKNLSRSEGKNIHFKKKSRKKPEDDRMDKIFKGGKLRL